MSGPTGNADSSEWIVRLERRSDGRIYYYDRSGNQNARMSSAMKLPRGDAIALAKAIRDNHKTLSAHAMRIVDTDKGTKKEVAE